LQEIAKVLGLSSDDVGKLAGQSDADFGELLTELNKLPTKYYGTVKARLLASLAAALAFVRKTLKELDNDNEPQIERNGPGGDVSGGR